MRRSMLPSQTLQVQVSSVAEEPALTPQDVLSRLVATILRDNIYDDKTRIVNGVSPYPRSTRRQLQIEQSRIQDIKIVTNRRRRMGTKKMQNDRSTKKSLLNVPSNEFHIKAIAKKAGSTESENKSFGRRTQSSNSDYLRAESVNSSPAFEKWIVESPPVFSQKSLSENRPKKSHRTRDKSITRKLLIQPIDSIEYANGNTSIATTLHDTSQNEKSLFLTEELIAKQAKLIKMLKIVRKNKYMDKNRNIKSNSK